MIVLVIIIITTECFYNFFKQLFKLPKNPFESRLGFCTNLATKLPAKKSQLPALSSHHSRLEIHSHSEENSRRVTASSCSKTFYIKRSFNIFRTSLNFIKAEPVTRFLTVTFSVGVPNSRPNQFKPLLTAEMRINCLSCYTLPHTKIQRLKSDYVNVLEHNDKPQEIDQNRIERVVDKAIIFILLSRCKL